MYIKKEHNPQPFSDAEIALLEEGVKRSYKERFEMDIFNEEILK